MIKKVLFGLVAIFLFVFTFAGVSNAAATNTSVKKTNGPHWVKAPINVYIPQDAQSGQMRNAFSKWQNASGNRIKFQYTAKAKADIIVIFTDKTDGLESELGGYSTKTNGTTITNGEIKIASKSKLAKKHTNTYIYNTMIHEVGHVIGMQHNSTKLSSVMYPTISENQNLLKLDIRRLYTVYGWSYADRNMPSQRVK